MARGHGFLRRAHHDRESEPRALARRGFRVDPSSHQFDEPFGDRQTQARSPVTMADGGIRLVERREQVRQLVRCNSNAAVADFDRDAIGRFVLPFHARREDNLAGIGKLYGV